MTYANPHNQETLYHFIVQLQKSKQRSNQIHKRKEHKRQIVIIRETINK
jgi:hypothetical protein